MKDSDPLRSLPNIGVKLASMLREIGIRNKNDIKAVGAANLYKKLQSLHEKRLPVCYYLYSLEGAIRGVHWNELSEKQKGELRRKAGLV